MSNHEDNPHLVLGPIFSSSNVSTSGGITMISGTGLHHSTINPESEDKHQSDTRYSYLFSKLCSNMER